MPAVLRVLEVVDDDAVAVAVLAGLGDVVVADVVGDDGPEALGGGVAGDVAVLIDRDAGEPAGAGIVVGRVAFNGLELGLDELDPVLGAVVDDVVEDVHVVDVHPKNPAAAAAPLMSKPSIVT